MRAVPLWTLAVAAASAPSVVRGSRAPEPPVAIAHGGHALGNAVAFGWPTSFTYTFSVPPGNATTITTTTPALPESVLALIAPHLAPGVFTVANVGSEGNETSPPDPEVDYNVTVAGNLLSLGAVDPQRNVTVTSGNFLVPSPANTTYVLTVFGPGGGDALPAFGVSQWCADGRSFPQRSLCAPTGTVDYWLDPASLTLSGGIAYRVGVAGCSADPADCGGSPDVCCLPGWAPVANGTVASCGPSCFNCSGACAPPSGSPTATGSPSQTPTVSATGTAPATRTPSRAAGGAAVTRHAAVAAVVAALLTALARVGRDA